MAPTKFINFLAVVSFAVFYISLTPIAANALAVERAHVARNLNYAHAGLAKKKRGESPKRCKPRPTTSTLTHSSEPPSYTPHSSHAPPSSYHAPPSSSYQAPHPSSSSTVKPQPHTTTSSSHSTAATPYISSGTPKVGLGWSNNEQSSICNFKTSNTKLVFNWKPQKYTDVNVAECGFSFIPTIWGASDAYEVPSLLVKGYADMVFTFNEPELSSQSNLGVDEAVELYMKYINPLQYLGYELVAPACTNSPTGVAWIKSFVSKVEQQGGKIHGVGSHYYGTSYSDLISFYVDFLKYFPSYYIMISEFAAEDYSGNNNQLDYAGIVEFLQKTTDWMQGQDQIKGYFWFGAMTSNELQQNNVNGLNSLMGSDDKPNQLGNMYIYP